MTAEPTDVRTPDPAVRDLLSVPASSTTGELPLATALEASPDLAFDRLASVVRRVLGVPVALVTLVDRDRQVFPGAAGLPDPYATTRTTPLSHSFCQHVVRGGAPFVVADARLDPLVSANLAIPDVGVVAYAGMPVVDESGLVVGSLCAIDTEPRRWEPEELALLEDLAAAASAEVAVRAFAAQAARSSRRWRVLSAMSEALAAPTTVEEVSAVVAELSRTWLGALFGGITVLDASGENLRYVDLGEVSGFPVDRRTFPVTSLRPSAVAVAERRPLFVASVDELHAMSPGSADAARAVEAVAFAYLPLQLGARVLGSVALVWRDPQPFDDDERELLLSLARYAALSLDRATMIAERRDVARTLQTALLPTLPDVDWLQVSGRYLPAHVADAVGGDWFDAFTTVSEPDGGQHLAVVVGDVTGHDTAAAAVMGRLQATLRALAVDAPDAPDRLLSRLDHVMARTGVDRMATAVAATVSASPDGEISLTWSNAGHLPPLELRVDAPTRYLERPVDLLLGLRADAERRTHTTVLAPGTTVLLFTDGLVERRGQAIDEGLGSLAYAAGLHRDLPLEDLLDRIVAAASAGGHDDDLVVFGFRVPGVTSPHS